MTRQPSRSGHTSREVDHILEVVEFEDGHQRPEEDTQEGIFQLDAAHTFHKVPEGEVARYNHGRDQEAGSALSHSQAVPGDTCHHGREQAAVEGDPDGIRHIHDLEQAAQEDSHGIPSEMVDACSP